jgi:hypothetical protein
VIRHKATIETLSRIVEGARKNDDYLRSSEDIRATDVARESSRDAALSTVPAIATTGPAEVLLAKDSKRVLSANHVALRLLDFAIAQAFTARNWRTDGCIYGPGAESRSHFKTACKNHMHPAVAGSEAVTYSMHRSRLPQISGRLVVTLALLNGATSLVYSTKIFVQQ